MKHPARFLLPALLLALPACPASAAAPASLTGEWFSGPQYAASVYTTEFGSATADARQFAARLTAALAAAGERAAVRLVDERMTTVSAHQALHAAGRKTKKHRSVIDQAAAVIILQSALDAERAKGERAGELVVVETVHDTHD